MKSRLEHKGHQTGHTSVYCQACKAAGVREPFKKTTHKPGSLDEIETFAKSVLVDQGIRFGSDENTERTIVGLPSERKARNLACAVMEHAAIIKAAPALLEAVRAALMIAEDLESKGQYIDYPRGMAFDGSFSGGLRAAIAKAEAR